MRKMACNFETFVMVVLCRQAVVVELELPVLEEDEELELLVLGTFVEVLVFLLAVLEVQLKDHRRHIHLGNISENSELYCLDPHNPQAKQ